MLFLKGSLRKLSTRGQFISGNAVKAPGACKAKSDCAVDALSLKLP